MPTVTGSITPSAYSGGMTLTLPDDCTLFALIVSAYSGGAITWSSGSIGGEALALASANDPGDSEVGNNVVLKRQTPTTGSGKTLALAWSTAPSVTFVVPIFLASADDIRAAAINTITATCASALTDIVLGVASSYVPEQGQPNGTGAGQTVIVNDFAVGDTGIDVIQVDAPGAATSSISATVPGIGDAHIVIFSATAGSAPASGQPPLGSVLRAGATLLTFGRMGFGRPY
jgi:hypothetical protein